MLSTSVSEYRDIREIEKGERVGLSPSVSEYRDTKTDRKSLNIEREWGQGGDGLLHMSTCAAKALFSCPAIISQRLESRIISNEPLENTEEESKII